MLPDERDGLAELLGNGTELEVVLRGHLWVEAALIALLEDVLPFPNLVDLARFTYPQKVALVAAHGFIRTDDVAAYLKLNSIRNKMAHNLTLKLTEADVEQLHDTFGKHLREMSDALATDEKFSWHNWEMRLKFCILVLYMALSHERDRLTEHRDILRAKNEALQRAAKDLLDAAEARGESNPE